MTVILAAMADRGPAANAPVGTDEALRRQLAERGNDPSDSAPLAPGVKLLGLLTWTRLHGITSLEIEGALEQTGVDAEGLLQS